MNDRRSDSKLVLQDRAAKVVGADVWLDPIQRVSSAVLCHGFDGLPQAHGAVVVHESLARMFRRLGSRRPYLITPWYRKIGFGGLCLEYRPINEELALGMAICEFDNSRVVFLPALPTGACPGIPSADEVVIPFVGKGGGITPEKLAGELGRMLVSRELVVVVDSLAAALVLEAEITKLGIGVRGFGNLRACFKGRKSKTQPHCVMGLVRDMAKRPPGDEWFFVCTGWGRKMGGREIEDLATLTFHMEVFAGADEIAELRVPAGLGGQSMVIESPSQRRLNFFS
ncbi:MAG: hypothetical protein VYA34_03070 [Myxococcota bacterium]|nr:hypothetical protein [Myxococcota bacterium]